jgi:hypothetical protein
MSKRLKVPMIQEQGQVNLFSRLAGRLRTLHARVQVDSTCRINVTEPLIGSLVQNTLPKERHWLSHEAVIDLLENNRKEVLMQESEAPQRPRTGVSGASVHRSTAELTAQHDRNFATPQDERQYLPGQYWDPLQEQQAPDLLLNNDDLFTISQSLIDPDFTGLDRVLNFDDMLLTGNSDTSMGWHAG